MGDEKGKGEVGIGETLRGCYVCVLCYGGSVNLFTYHPLLLSQFQIQAHMVIF